MFKQFFNGVQDKYKQMQEENRKYQELLTRVFLLPKFYPYTIVDKKQLTVSYKLLMHMCSDLNEQDAIAVRGLLPIEEVCLSCLYATECKTGVKFYFVASTKYLWLIHKEGYLKYRYSDLGVEVVKNGVLSKTLLLGNMLFMVNGTQDDLLGFVRLLQDSTYREELIRSQEEMFCGTVPCLFYLNQLASGISVGKNHELVFHTREFHYKYMISDIKNYELLMDDMVVREKKTNRRGMLTANKNSCYEMSLRITANDREFLLPILEKTAFTSLYASTSVEFMESKEFSEKMIGLLDDMNDAMLNGEL